LETDESMMALATTEPLVRSRIALGADAPPASATRCISEAPVGRPAVPQYEPVVRDPLEDLWHAANAGDADATRRLLLALAPSVATVVRGIMGVHHSDLEDVEQMSLVAFVSALSSFRGECRVRHFACRIALRTALAAQQRSRKRERGRRLWERFVAPLIGEGEPSSNATSALSSCRKAWQDLISELPPAQAETLVLRVVLDYSLEETAEATGVPLNTVRSRIRLAREALRRRIESDPTLADLLGGAE
jgi:RNA polymerase sigma-70 factor (ECF subfamily)